MTRNLKALGLALMAVFAMSAVAAQGASAQQGVLTSDGPVFLVGTELPEGNSFSYPGLPTTSCKESHARIGRIEANPIQAIESGATEFTNIGTLTTNCKVGIFPVTVKTTSCDFQYFIGETVSGSDTYSVGGSMECAEPGDTIDVEIYSNAAHTNKICALAFGPQTPKVEMHATDTTDGSIRVHGKITGVHATRTNFGGCPPSGTTSEAQFNINVEGTGENQSGEPTAISLSH